MLRVLGLVHRYAPVFNAGAESHIHTMLRALVARGHRVDVVLSDQTGAPYVHDGVHVWPAVDPRRDASAWLPDADVLVAHLENTTRATVLGRFNAIPVAVVHHNTFMASRQALLLPSSRTDVVAVNSRWMQEGLMAFLAEHDAPAPTTVTVRPVADPIEYATTPGERVTLVNMRRHDPDAKPLDGLILSKGGEVFRALAEWMPDVGFLGVTGSYGTQQEVDDLGNVEVLDHVPHDRMRDLVYARTRVLLVPSNYESWGRVASEALCSGIPVVASPTPGLVEQLGDAGLYADPGDFGAWHAIVEKLMTNDDFWQAQSALATTRAAELADVGTDDLRRWVQAVEAAVATDYETRTA